MAELENLIVPQETKFTALGQLGLKERTQYAFPSIFEYMLFGQEVRIMIEMQEKQKIPEKAAWNIFVDIVSLVKLMGTVKVWK